MAVVNTPKGRIIGLILPEDKPKPVKRGEDNDKRRKAHKAKAAAEDRQHQ